MLFEKIVDFIVVAVLGALIGAGFAWSILSEDADIDNGATTIPVDASPDCIGQTNCYLAWPDDATITNVYVRGSTVFNDSGVGLILKAAAPEKPVVRTKPRPSLAAIDQRDIAAQAYLDHVSDWILHTQSIDDGESEVLPPSAYPGLQPDIDIVLDDIAVLRAERVADPTFRDDFDKLDADVRSLQYAMDRYDEDDVI